MLSICCVSLPEFIATWAILPFLEWGVEIDIPANMLASGDRCLLDPDYNGAPTALSRRLSRGEALGQSSRYEIADGVVNRQAIKLCEALRAR